MLLVQRSCTLDVAVAVRRTISFVCGPQTCVCTQMPPTPPSSRNGNEMVVAGVEVEAESLGDPPRLLEVVVRLLHGDDVLDLCELRDRLRLDVDDDAARDVVDDHRLVGGGGDLLEVADDCPLRRLVVVRRHDEDRVDAEPRAPLRQGRGVAGVVGAGARDDGRAVTDRVDGGSRRARASPRRSASGSRRSSRRRRPRPSRCRRGRSQARGTFEVDRAVRVERRHHRG